MNKSSLCLLWMFAFAICSGYSQDKEMVYELIDAHADQYKQVAHQIWEYAELGYQEEKSSALLQKLLQEADFKVESGVAGIPTAFVASWGTGGPVIGILAEFDALPGVSQQAVPRQEPVPGGTAGHACGHHLFGTASTAAAIAVKNWMEAEGIGGTIKLFGTPAEEGGAGKVYMVRAGLFNGVDAMLHWHPGSMNSASAASSLANKSAKFRFYGAASHAAVAPQNGRSALDGVEAMNFMVNMMREHISSDARIHYVITSGGEAPNVVPAFAEVFYYVRHPYRSEVQDIFQWVAKAAEAAALGTETRMEYEVIHGVYNLMPNEALSRIVHSNLQALGGLSYNAKEMAFAKEIERTLPEKARRPLERANQILPFQVIEKGGGGSTDVGDVSWVVPTAGLVTATWVPGTSPHTWQAVAAGGMSIGHKGMLLSAKVLAASAIDLMQRPDVLRAAKVELSRRTGQDFQYTSLLGDRPPPLDYRK